MRRLFQGGSHRQARVRIGTLLLLATGLALVAFFWTFQPFGSLQNRLTDSLFRPRHKPDGIVIATIDDESLKTYGNFSDWPRSLHAQAIKNLSAAGARVIISDLLFVDPSADPSQDQQLAASMKSAGNVVLAESGASPVGTSAKGRLDFQAILSPQEPLRSATGQFGHINFQADQDGVLRRLPLFITGPGGKKIPSVLVSALYAQSQRQAPEDMPIENGRISVLSQRVPVDSAGQMRPDFVATLDNFDRLSYADAIRGTFDPAAIKGKIVLIGLTATGTDSHATPLGGSTEGVVVLGNALNGLLNGDFIREATRTDIALGLLPLVIVTMYVVPRFSIRLSALVVVALAIGDYLFSILLFNQNHLIMNFVFPGLLLPAMYVVGLGYKVSAERADRRELGDLFGRYASPEIVQALADAADRGSLEMGGTMREVTVLFADLRGFTGISERLPPDEVVAFLNQAFEIMIRCIARNDGVVNKFGGDMVMAIWNAPREATGHALKACRAALEAVQELQPLTTASGSYFGFGINSGDVVAGNVGSRGRLEYTVMGDPVNVASRLCGIAGGGEVYIGGRTRELAAGGIDVVDLGPQTVKGRTRPVEAYKVIAIHDASAVAAVAGA